MPLWPLPKYTNEAPALIGTSNAEWWYKTTGIAPLWTGAAWTVADLVVFTPIVITEMIPLALLWLGTDQTAGGNNIWDLGIYSMGDDGKPDQLIASVGGFTWAASPSYSAVLRPSIPIPPLAPGIYFMASVNRGTTDKIYRVAFVNPDLGEAYGIFTQSSTFPLPEVAEPTLAAVAFSAPIMGIVAG